MALEGFLQEFGLADILQLIYFQKKTGVLSIDGKLDSIELNFINGNISGLKSQRRLEGNRLGRILIKKGLIKQDDLNAAMEAQKTEGLKLGNYFVKHGLVSKEALVEVIQEQIIETIVQVFSWKEGRYEFIPQGVPADKELPVQLDTQHLLMDGLRIVDEWSIVEGKLDLNVVYKKVSEPETGKLSGIEQEVLELVDNERDVMSIIDSSDSGDFETAKAIISLQEKGVIEPVGLPFKEEAAVIKKEPGYSFFTAIYGVIFIILVSVFIGNFYALNMFRGVRSSFAMERLKNDVDIYNAVNGFYPHSLGTITEKEKDLWGRPYVYKLTEDGFKLFSSGPDGVEGTGDDVY